MCIYVHVTHKTTEETTAQVSCWFLCTFVIWVFFKLYWLGFACHHFISSFILFVYSSVTHAYAHTHIQ